MFNTNENITTFIPNSSNSMLVITEENAYKIYPIKNGNTLIHFIIFKHYSWKKKLKKMLFFDYKVEIFFALDKFI